MSQIALPIGLDFQSFVKKNRVFINKTCNRLQALNREYSPTEIRGIVFSAIFNSKDLNKKGIYLSALNRILDEKGLTYRKNKLYKPTIRATENDEQLVDIASFQKYNHQHDENMQDKVASLLSESDLTQDEVFVTALSFGLSTPYNLQGKYKEMLDNIEDMYYHRLLKKKEIANIMGLTVRGVNDLQKKAFKKLGRIGNAPERL